jgi:L-gulonolactone oxidase
MPDRHVWRNWARNQVCAPAAMEDPRSLLEVVEAVQRARSAGQTVKVVGSGHSFTDAACTDGRLLSIDALDRVLEVDRDAGTVTVEAGITIRALNQELASRGLALRNLGDIDRQTLAGALSTGTHGTGARLGGLATFIRGMELVTADGEVLRCSPEEEPEVFHCARVGLGALGVVTKLTLDCVPTFTLRHVERAAKLREVVGELDDLADGHDHFELYWLPHTDTVSLLCNDRTDDAPRPKSAYKRWRAEVFYPNYFFGALVTAGRVRPESIPRIASVVAGTVGSARLVDRSDRILISTRLLRFVEMEYAIPREHAAEAVLAVRDLIEAEDLRVSFPVEVRFAASDDVPLSTAHGRDSCYVAVHMARGLPHERYFDGVERIMDRVGGRPHWGKLHGQSAATLAPRYPEWDRFTRLRERLDPDGRFANAYLDRVLGSK